MTFYTHFVICLLFHFAHGYYDYCEYPLIENTNAKLTATSKLPGRGPEHAKITSGYAWTAGSSDFEQYLEIDLTQPKNVTRIGTKGRPHPSEFIREFIISFSVNGQDFAIYKENDGSAKLFRGNDDGENIHYNDFDTPIIAQFIRINPTRWRDRISMRVELYGCDYVSETLSFNGSSIVYRNLTYYPIQSRRDSIKFRFRTSQPDGILIYSKGTQGDYFALQLVDNRLLLNINLGSGSMTSVSAGSLLDDSLWHDVTIKRVLNQLSFTVDRVDIRNTLKGDFQQLDLNKVLYIGGVPHIEEGLIIGKNFTGCIENLYLNHTNVIHNLKNVPYEESEIFYSNFTFFNCQDSTVVPITFISSPRSYVKILGYEGMRSLNVSFEFRTYEERGLLLYHTFTSNGYFKLYLEKSKLLIEIETDKTPKLTLDNFAENFNNGLWHRLLFTISHNSITLSIDERVVKTTRLIEIMTGNYYFFGGGAPDSIPFTGCMRLISVDGNQQNPLNWKIDEQYCCKDTIVFDSCQMLDRCNPNPCEHNGACRQSSSQFECICSDTGYSGAVCHTPLHPISCQAYRNTHSTNQKSSILIDPDGSGPLDPFRVTCQYYIDGTTHTEIHHESEDSVLVDGYSEPGSFVQNIEYDGSLEQIEAVVNRSTSCRQYIKYECRNSKLFNSPSRENEPFRPNSWWVSRRNQGMDYWGDSLPGSRKCDCGILNQCKMEDKWCNCDSGFDDWLSDEGYLTEIDDLPVRQIRIGDTGTVTDDKIGKFTLGSLVCSGDDLYDNVVTFRLSDASLRFPTPELGHSWDIYFEFKTTAANAVMLHSKGTSDYIKVSIIGGDQIQFLIESGSGPMGASVETSNRLNDNQWHSVHIEKNRKQSRIVVDGSHSSTVTQPQGQVRAIELTSDLFIGSTTDSRDGFVGCIRAILLNGRMLNIKERLAQNEHLYGLGMGCNGRCDSTPCLNNGTCTEGYDHYTCDCRFSAFKGPICADEIGINLQSNSMIRYDFIGSYKSTIAEKVRIGFTTTQPQGFLMGVFSNITGEYFTVQVSNSGHLRIVFDFGFERQEKIFENQNFATGQYHDVQIARMDSGTKLVVKVDNLEPMIFTFDVKNSADAQFNNIQYLYIGKNESMREGFIGCISRVEFDDIYPLKYYFQENRPAYIRSSPEDLIEDFCGVEPVTHPPDIPETRPAPKVDDEKVRRMYRTPQSAILGGVLAVLFIAIVLMALLIGRYLSQHKGEYLTQEDEGAAGAIDPNDAIIHSTTGHTVHKKKEWFI